VNDSDLVFPEDLELDFDEAELAKAQVPILPDAELNPESTHQLTEAPWPAGAVLNSSPVLEPVLSPADDDETVSEAEAHLGPPTFFTRLGLGAETGGLAKVEKLADGTWSLTVGGLWPVFVRRFHPAKETDPAFLKRLALAARRFADNRLCLGPGGELDVFFNDRGSMEKFNKEIAWFTENGVNQPPKIRLPGPVAGRPGGANPVRLTTCRGLFDCPHATVDTLSAAQKLTEIFTGHVWNRLSGRRRPPLMVSVAGCLAGCREGCGIYEYADLRLTGRRETYPEIDQELAALSSKISLLVSGCPGRALKRSHQPMVFLEIEREACRRCGWCASVDPAFGWPEPQGGYFSLELSGRRMSPPYEFIPPRTFWPKLPGDWVEVGHKLIELIEIWRGEAGEGETISDFARRRGLCGPGANKGTHFSDPPAASI
jgi:dissimilatory sulfite reductase (desulfoviridin) alpha/beta subunit